MTCYSSNGNVSVDRTCMKIHGSGNSLSPPDLTLFLYVPELIELSVR